MVWVPGGMLPGTGFAMECMAHAPGPGSSRRGPLKPSNPQHQNRISENVISKVIKVVTGAEAAAACLTPRMGLDGLARDYAWAWMGWYVTVLVRDYARWYMTYAGT